MSDLERLAVLAALRDGPVLIRDAESNDLVQVVGVAPETAPLTRPALRWHGGKWRIAPWIIDHMPAHRTYIEPYGGAASVLLRKPRSYAEIYNDLDAEVVSFFRVLRSPRAAELLDALRLTPFARSEFELAYETSDDPVEEARRLVVRSFMGFGSDGFNRAVRTGFRGSVTRSGTTPASDWAGWPDAAEAIVARLAGVVIENRPGLEVIRKHDAPDALHYIDPPYLGETRSDKSRKGGGKYHAYRHEMTDGDHAEMLEAVVRLRGMVILSGYHHPIYDEALDGWRKVERDVFADGARARTEVLWLNRRATEAAEHGPLFNDR